MSQINVNTVTTTTANVSGDASVTGTLSAGGLKHASANTSALTPNADGSVSVAGNVTTTGVVQGNTIRTGALQDLNGDPLSTGQVLQVVQRVSNSYGEFGNSAYGNNLGNLTAIGDWWIDITSTVANSKFLIQWKTKMYGPNTQHQYVDLRRRVGGSGSFTSLIETTRTNSTIDTFAGIHWQNGNGAFEGDYFSTFIDSPNQPVNTVIRYQQYLGGWAGGTIDFGGWDAANNQNARGMIVMIAWELAP
ncbi:hypothetical protein P29A0810_041 [Synechococcus phage S-CAM8]|jgi:hypothetical protein|uniref:Uncharacterized protein n=1 Tax=Synechococcus phage S-CAM8 TaxID=754038 RepID=A0A1D8KN12_9CAUD|nr:hypothetical protein P29A0810_041 [Synechococcus phage S-CAM8]